jgi:hypothetical protein
MMNAAAAYNPQLPGAALSPVGRLLRLRLVRAFADTRGHRVPITSRPAAGLSA